jgi:hypothetical protein
MSVDIVNSAFLQKECASFRCHPQTPCKSNNPTFILKLGIVWGLFFAKELTGFMKQKKLFLIFIYFIKCLHRLCLH